MAWATNPGGADGLPSSDAQSVRIMPLEVSAVVCRACLIRRPRRLRPTFGGVRLLAFDPRPVQLGSHVSALGVACQVRSCTRLVTVMVPMIPEPVLLSSAGSVIRYRALRVLATLPHSPLDAYIKTYCIQPVKLLVRSVAGCRESGLADSPRAAL